MSQPVQTRSLWVLPLLVVWRLQASADEGAGEWTFVPPDSGDGHPPTPWAAPFMQGLDTELPKAVVTLDPPWINVVQEDWVTLHCQGPHSPEDHDTRWFHNDSSLGAEGPRSLSFQAASNASGEYRCQTRHSGRSDPVRLAVRAEWLLLQTPALHFREGDPIVLRCHSWRNRPLFKVTFFQDGVAKRFSHGNRNFSIPQANASHSGAYHCQGVIGKTPHTSRPVTITVGGGQQGASSLEPKPLSTSPPWLHVALYLAVTLLLAANTGLYLSVCRDVERAQRGWRPARWSRGARSL